MGHPEFSLFLTSGTIRVRPRANWRGQYEGGLFSGGWPECTGTNGPNCVFTDWPAQTMHTYLDGQSRPLGDWLGSLVQDQREASGCQATPTLRTWRHPVLRTRSSSGVRFSPLRLA
jgi:hypothetical protein